MEARPMTIPALAGIRAADGDRVVREQIATAVTAGRLEYGDGASQVFESNGSTTYLESGRPTRGEWTVDDDGHFCSFWPPRYRASYDLRWTVDNETITGLRFVALTGGAEFVGRYRVVG
jgi:hypothetical protein